MIEEKPAMIPLISSSRGLGDKPFMVKNAAWVRKDLQEAKNALRSTIMAMRAARLQNPAWFWRFANLTRAIRKNIKKHQRRLLQREFGSNCRGVQ